MGIVNVQDIFINVGNTFVSKRIEQLLLFLVN